MKSIKSIVVFCFLSVVILEAFSQEKSDTVLTLSDKKEFVALSLQKSKFTPFIAPAFAPETDLMIVAGGLFTFKLRPLDSLIQRSSIPFSIGYSTNNSFLFNIRPTVFGINGKYNVNGDIWIKKQPDHYFGIGYENGRNVPKTDTTTLYQRYWWQINLNILRVISPKFNAGISLDLNRTRGTELNPVMAMDPNVLEFGKDNKNSGIGVIVQYDTRDVEVNPYKGILVGLTATFYGKFLRGDNEYQVYQLDYRQYQTIRRPGRTLAWALRWRVGRGAIPWPEMSQLGTPFDLRGYRWGQYRDKSLQFGLVEYRHMFKRKKPAKDGSMISKHGFVTWTGIGNIAPRTRDIDEWLPNVGLGYRFEIQKRMNARVDFGIGTESTGFYVSFNEAF